MGYLPPSRRPDGRFSMGDRAMSRRRCGAALLSLLTVVALWVAVTPAEARGGRITLAALSAVQVGDPVELRGGLPGAEPFPGVPPGPRPRFQRLTRLVRGFPVILWLGSADLFLRYARPALTPGRGRGV